jgi:ribosomal-protein-alanine N-acetyltransferase
MQFPIETERLILREILPSDDQSMFELDSDEAVHEFLGKKPVQTIHEIRNIIERIRTDYTKYGVGRLAVVEKNSLQFIGWAGLKFVPVTINQHHDFYDVGYRLQRKYWGMGYATEAAQASVQYAWKYLNIPLLHAFADCNNVSSRNVLQKTGFKYINDFYYENDLHAWYELKNPFISQQ